MNVGSSIEVEKEIFNVRRTYTKGRPEALQFKYEDGKYKKGNNHEPMQTIFEKGETYNSSSLC